MNLDRQREPLLPRQNPGVGVGIARSTEITLKEFGKRVTLKDSCYAKTNHFIVESRPYFRNRWLFKYCYCPRLRWFIAFCFLVNIFAFTSLYLALCMDGLNFIFLAIFTQHLFVHCHTMKYVRQQPVVRGEKSLNSFYKVTVRELSGLYLEAYNQGLGFVNLATGEVQFQVFNEVAIKIMQRAKQMSHWFLYTTFLMCAMSGVGTWLTWGKWSRSQQFEIFRN